jgi:hypothetical protein
MKIEMSPRVLVVIGRHGHLPALIEGDRDRDVLVLALGPRVTPEQQRAVEHAVAAAFDRRVQLEARIATLAETAAAIAGVSDDENVRLYGLTRRERRALGLPR